MLDKAHHGINIKEDEWHLPIYRIFSLERFKDMMLSKQLTLVRPRKWDDPFENFLLKCTVKSSDGPMSLAMLEQKWYGQCWTLNENTDAMWRIYSPQKDGVQVSTTIEKLFHAMCSKSSSPDRLAHFIGRIEYVPREQIIEFLQEFNLWNFISNAGGRTRPFAELLCFKREAFKHENEVRILLHDFDARDDAVSIDIEPNQLFDKIVLDPRLEENVFGCQKEELKQTGWTLDICQSDLYKISQFEIEAH